MLLAAALLGSVGAVSGLALTHNHCGFMAALGIASPGGVVTDHAIALFEHPKREREHGLKRDEALIPSIAGLLPPAFSSQTLWRPFCRALIFGLGGRFAA